MASVKRERTYQVVRIVAGIAQLFLSSLDSKSQREVARERSAREHHRRKVRDSVDSADAVFDQGAVKAIGSRLSQSEKRSMEKE